MKIKALVAVRSGSQRVVNKNLRPFGDSNLLKLKIEQLKRISLLDGVVVNSNDDKMLQIAKDLGGEVVKRNEYYASNSVCMSDVYEDMAKNFNGDIIVYANVTNPLLNDETIEEAIRYFISNQDKIDSLNTGHLLKEFMFINNQPLNYRLDKQPRSQELPNIYALNFALSIISKENMIKYKNVVGNKPYIYGIDYYQATDIDNEIDFEIAEFLWKKRMNLI